jgi:hypothetical protein
MSWKAERPEDPLRRRSSGLGLLVLAVAVVASAGVRIGLGLGEAGFDPVRPERVLKSDPALLYYVTERILDAGGRPPGDFRADPRVAHPETVDLPATFSVGQEFLAAWLYRATGSEQPLHVFCVWLFAFVASLAAIGVYGLALETTGRRRFAALAVVLFVASPAAYRTAGFVLIREDLSLPLFALHVFLLARAVRVGGAAAHGLAGLALLTALATWHAMSFVVTVEVACLFAWFLRSGESPFAAPGAWCGPVVVAAGSLAVPLLWSTGFLLSPPALGVLALAAAEVSRRLGVGGRAAPAAVAVLGLAAGLGLAHALEVGADHRHVHDLVWAKLRHLGERPLDPSLLSFDARLLWHGPFETASVRELVAATTVGLVLLPVAIAQAIPIWWRGRGDRLAAVTVAFAAAFAVLALLMRRNLVVYGMASPVVAVWVLSRLRPGTWTPWIAGLAAAQLVAGAGILPHRELRWYVPAHQRELEHAIEWMRRSLPDEGAVAADFVNSTAVLAHTRRPIVLQPKYETVASRRRSREFFETFFFGTAADLHAWLERYRCRFLLVDRATLWGLRYLAGLPEASERPAPGTAAADFLARDPGRPTAAGFRLRYRSPLASDHMRLYEIE